MSENWDDDITNLCKQLRANQDSQDKSNELLHKIISLLELVIKNRAPIPRWATCSNCRFLHKSSDAAPCVECSEESKWEPAT